MNSPSDDASCPLPPADINRALLDAGIIGGFDVSDAYPNGLLLCCTELNSRAEIDRLVDLLMKLAATAPAQGGVRA